MTVSVILLSKGSGVQSVSKNNFSLFLTVSYCRSCNCKAGIFSHLLTVSLSALMLCYILICSMCISEILVNRFFLLCAHMVSCLL